MIGHGNSTGVATNVFNVCNRETLTALKPTLDESKLPLLIFVNKGVEIKTRALTLEIIADTCGPEVAKVATFIVSTMTAHHLTQYQVHFRSRDLRLPQKVSGNIVSGISSYRRPTVVRRQPTSVSVVSLSPSHAEQASQLFHQPWFRW